MTTSGIEDDNETIEEINKNNIPTARVVLQGVLKKRNSLGLFYKRLVTLTEEPKLFYLKTSEKGAGPKQISFNDNTKLERLDSTKFKIYDNSKGKKAVLFIFRCSSAQECEHWVLRLNFELEKLREIISLTPEKRAQVMKQQSLSSISVNSAQLKTDSRDSTPQSAGGRSHLTKSAHKTPSQFAP